MTSALVIVAGYVALICAAGWPGALMVAVHLVLMIGVTAWKAKP